MAKSDNLFLKGARGTIGGLLTLSETKSGRTILKQRRGKSTKPASEKQLIVQGRFKRAITYGRAAIKDPVKKAAYQAVAGPDESAFNVACRDAFTPPVVDKINLTGYHGQISDAIRIVATDDFKVVTVHVQINTAAGELLEMGTAMLDANGLDWSYQTTTINDALPGTKITVTAVDVPGNETVKEVEV